ncbi:uncharacterized protein LOC120692774 isoform X1 [Panicum virgatum]|uniref:uncharacterized protein LOC120692774 isoform X1 n=1 Tax=Panicum virgatum TaxID=38727 RepID=UPI0019D52297|nr:uncharacterized protein LOC120692774 isoform X1 [Panicum virgatum]
MGKRGNESDYESLRDARIAENKARFEMLGLRCAKEELNAMVAPARRSYTYKQYATGPPRRSPRLNGQAVKHQALPLAGVLGKAMAVVVEEKEEEEGEESDHGAPAVVDEQMDTDGKGMGDVYDSVPMETAISAGTHTFAELLQPYIYFIQGGRAARMIAWNET